MSQTEFDRAGKLRGDDAVHEDAIDRFEDAWAARQQPSIEEYISDGVADRFRLIKELVHIDLEYRLKSGQKARLEDYFKKLPELESNQEDLVELLSREFELRCRRERPSVDEYAKRFPKLRDRLAPVLQKLSSGSTIVYQHAGRETAGSALGWKEKRETHLGNEPLIGRFELVELLGGGGFGSVYRAKDLKLGREVAIKLPRPGVLEGKRQVKRFIREAQVAAKLNHPNICPVFGIEQCDDVPFIVMGYIQGSSLAQFMASGKQFTDRQAAYAVYKLCMALAEAHANGIIHRDLKPSNVMIQANHRGLVILDFGLARQMNANDTQLTRSGDVMGTPVYMPPEQVRGKVREIGPKSDIYSLGVMLYELLTRRLPFTGSAAEIFAQILYENPVPPSQHHARISPVLESICLKAMSKSPEDRFDSMQAFGKSLKGFLTGKLDELSTEPAEPGELEWAASVPDLPKMNFTVGEVVAPGGPELQGSCPKCGVEIAQGVLLCNACGYHQGLHHKFDVLAKRPQGKIASGDRVILDEHLEKDETLMGVIIWGSLFGVLVLFVAFTILHSVIGGWTFPLLLGVGGVVVFVGARLLGWPVNPRSLLLYLRRLTSWRQLWWPFESRNILDLRGDETTDADVASLKPSWNLEVLDLDATAVTDQCLMHVAQLSTLRFIVLRGTSVTTRGLEDLKLALPKASVWT